MDLLVRKLVTARLAASEADADRLASLIAHRRRKFDQTSSDGRRFHFPVMAALVPVATSRGGEVAYPGDPMCLYSALVLSIERSVARRSAGLSPLPRLDDVYPDWGSYPDADYRRTADGQRVGFIADNKTTDGKVFDPRVWDDEARSRYIEELERLQPLVIMLSAVSPAHRYALDMAAIAKRILPDCLVILGGRHADETVWARPGAEDVDISWSSTVEVIRDGRSERVVDFIVSGDGAPLLDALLQSISLLVEPSQTTIDPLVTLDVVQLVLGCRPDLAGSGTIIGFGPDAAVVQPVKGRLVDRSELPSPYKAFSIRARFDVFGHGRGKRTAHVMTMDTCPFRCTFCSESIAVKGHATRFLPSEAEKVSSMVAQMSEWGAEAVFFDDPVFWGGNWGAISDFCQHLSNAQKDQPGRRVEWGAQLTVDVVLNSAKQVEVNAALDAMREAGCTYIYIGIESMSDLVMRGVNKNLLRRNPGPWREKVRAALSILRDRGIRVGSSVLFGLDGESRKTIEETVEEIGKLVDEGLLIMASPNILTYHPNTSITAAHGREELDYHTLKDNRPPYSYFEEAYPEVVSGLLTEGDIWYIHEASQLRWGNVRNTVTEK